MIIRVTADQVIRDYVKYKTSSKNASKDGKAEAVNEVRK